MLSLVLPVRNWPDERANACVDSFLALRSKLLTEIIVVDFGSTPPVDLKPRRKAVVKLLRLEADCWSPAEAINAGVAIASNPIIAKCDADMQVSPTSRLAFDRAVTEVADGEVGLLIAQPVDLEPDLGVADTAKLLKAGREPAGRLRPKWGQGGLIFFACETWERIGGCDSRFTGWGNEDNDFAERVRLSGRRIGWTDREALRLFHVWHPPSYAATGVIKQRQRNQKIAKDDRSVFRPIHFPNSNFNKLAAPEVMRRLTPMVTLAVATTDRPFRDRMTLEAINSFRGQIDNDFEIVVMDNGSSEAATTRLKSKLDKLRWPASLRFEAMSDSSIPGARNAITAMARGRYVCVVDDDDIALPNRLADHLKCFESDGLAHGSHGGWIDFDESSGVIERNSGKERTLATLLRGTGKITAHPACLYRTDALRAVPYDESFMLGSDLDLAIRLGALGFEIKHTHSYLTLRRYHSANVTITGKANQMSNGALARSRALNSIAWNKQKGLDEAAKKINDEVYCRNQMSMDGLAALIPGYTGSWQIHVPISALVNTGIGHDIESGAGLLGEPDAETPSLIEVPATRRDAGLPTAEMNTPLLHSLLEITHGTVCTRRSGLNQALYFRSKTINGLRAARRVRERIEDLLGMPVELSSARQAELDREVAFNWKAIVVKSGERMLQSERFADLSDLLVAFSRIPAGSLLRKTVSILADYDEDGEAYYLMTPPLHGYDALRSLKFDLERRTQLHFRHLAGNGVASELTLSRSA